MKRAVNLQTVAFIVAVILLLYQSLCVRDIREPWAEDATDILAAALSGSWNPFSPLVEMIFFAGRLFGLAAYAISIEWAPVILAVISIVLYSFIASYFCRPGFSWLVPDDRLRFLAAISVAVASGTPEVVGNIVCITYTLPVWGILLLLERPHARGLVFKWLFILLSSPLLFIAIPLLIMMYVVRRNKIYLVLLGMNGLSLMLSLILRERLDHPVSPAELRIDWQLLNAIDMLWGGLLAALVGGSTVIDYICDPLAISLLGLVLCVVIIWSMRKSNAEVASILIGLLAVVPLYHALHSIGRSYGYAQLNPASALLWYARTSFYTVLFPMIVWLIVIPQVTQRFSVSLQRVILAVVLLVNVTLFKKLPFHSVDQKEGTWREFQKWVQYARKEDAERGSGAQLVVRLPSSLVWATLYCTRKELSISCRTEGPYITGEVYEFSVQKK